MAGWTQHLENTEFSREIAVGEGVGPSVYTFAGYSPFNFGDPYGLCIGNLPCPEWVRRTGRSLGGFFYQVPVTAKEIALLPAAALQADYRARKQRIDAYLAGGYSALEEERGVQAAHTKEGAKRAIPIYGTILQAGEIVASYEQGGAFEGGRQVFRATFSLGGDVTLAYGAARGVQAARSAAAGPEVTYASMLEEMQGEVAAARAASKSRTPEGPAFLTAEGLLALPRAGTIDPSRIRFSQDSISFQFKEGAGSVDDLITGLKSGRFDPSSIPPIRIVAKDGKVFTLDNRRLYAFQHAGVEIPYQRLDAIPRRELGKFRTANEGTSITVRGQRQ
ncbi:MAG: hypothetical protein HC897_10735 [Thermoanaerobaculia bacterium]|nr:hypothetical protein [Thermoanaerobaculia bacterium]